MLKTLTTAEALLTNDLERVYTLTHKKEPIFKGSKLDCFLRILNLRQKKFNSNCLKFALNYDNYKLTLKH